MSISSINQYDYISHFHYYNKYMSLGDILKRDLFASPFWILKIHTAWHRLWLHHIMEHMCYVRPSGFFTSSYKATRNKSLGYHPEHNNWISFPYL